MILSRAGRIATWILVLASLYILGYFVLMARNAPAIESTDEFVFRSSFRWAKTAGRIDLVEVYQITVFNYIFYPADVLYYTIAPRDISVNTIDDQKGRDKE